ncbi:MAG: tRNA glutamyl-Q(34) synthetase GluQRS [Deltaproteobacteria bacterium]|nr:tRNA glutamyl-Q(34) synthetase GluQRS [Deltaproteobacteria bacterium]
MSAADHSGAGRGRYAPSPTGRLHAGNARTALLAWLAARIRRAPFVMRIEDLDRSRVIPGAEAALLDDLFWLGLDWDEGPDRGGAFGPYRQTERGALYDAAIERLLAMGRAFPCACSRAEIARAASAPHAEDEEGPRYPGTCRAAPRREVEARARDMGRPPAIRFDGRGECIAFVDEVHGRIDPFGAAGIDDFVLRRSDGVAAYQLAVVVDDAAMQIGQVVRGQDLLLSTPRQIALYQALGWTPPRFAHVPLLLTRSGDRMAKRTRPTEIADLRARGCDPAAVVGQLAASAGLLESGVSCAPRDLLARFIDRLPSGNFGLWVCLDRQPAIWD